MEPLARSVDAESHDALPGLEQLQALHNLTAGEQPLPGAIPLGVCGGMELLGSAECLSERAKWFSLLRKPDDEFIAAGSETYRSVPPNHVRNVYFSTGWYPVLREPLEANYAAVDLTPDFEGRVGQVVAVGRDEETHAVLAPDLVSFLDVLRAQVEGGEWRLVTTTEKRSRRRVIHREGRLLSVLVRRVTQSL